MAPEAFLALLVYAFVTSVTPGPNNIMLLASGVNFGFVKTIPHMLGIGTGFLVLLLAIGFGLGAVLTAFPALHTVLKIAGGAYLLYLAWKIAMSRTLAGKGEAKARPMRFIDAAAFQWVNPKAWVMAITAMAVYTNENHPFLSVVMISAAFAVVNLPSVSVWAGFGTALRGFLSSPARLRWFNITMGLLLSIRHRRRPISNTESQFPARSKARICLWMQRDCAASCSLGALGFNARQPA
jgi:threonine/homoserine/homoserine lactone efflux protein